MRAMVCSMMFFFMISIGYCGDWPEFAGVWMYSDTLNKEENIIVYEISPDTFSITITVIAGESSYDESIELEILDYNEDNNQIKTSVISITGGEIYPIHSDEIVYWKYNETDSGGLCFAFSTDDYPGAAETGPFESSEFNSGERWSEFAGIWFWGNELGDSCETFVFSSPSNASDLARLEVYVEGEEPGYVQFEIPSFDEGSNTIRLICLESQGYCEGYTIGSTWYLSYSIENDLAYFELSPDGFPKQASCGPYSKMTDGM